jgi:hypothetical protein
MKMTVLMSSLLFAGSLVISAFLLRPQPTPPYELWNGKFCDYLINRQTGSVWRYYEFVIIGESLCENSWNIFRLLGEGCHN